MREAPQSWGFLRDDTVRKGKQVENLGRQVVLEFGFFYAFFRLYLFSTRESRIKKMGRVMAQKR